MLNRRLTTNKSDKTLNTYNLLWYSYDFLLLEETVCSLQAKF